MSWVGDIKRCVEETIATAKQLFAFAFAASTRLIEPIGQARETPITMRERVRCCLNGGRCDFYFNRKTVNREPCSSHKAIVFQYGK